jgi:uncharacterized protein YyaL (SSP411 family)
MNRLANETSPYLLQHAHNPVDWYPWGEEALQRAKAEDKPILVSIGYSACHWCHVMERESFEDPVAAAFMNEHFVNIKVDREERPDIDHIYMDAVQALSGSGGWPLNVFLTPEARPFYGGTYFPPVRAFNRASWKEVMSGVARAFREQRDQVEDQSRQLTDHLQTSNRFGTGAINLDIPLEEKFTPSQLEQACLQAMSQADRQWGGFGKAPKFPQTFTINYLIRHHHFTKDPEALDQALLSLDKMIMGGIYDHIGGGFARYATDTEWLVPHFEKMLYDNALLVLSMCEAWQATRNPVYATYIRETLRFVERELLDGEGGFYSALDADSEGVEGKFYTWTRDEVMEVLGEDGAWFCGVYDISEGGNWEHVNIPRLLKWPWEHAGYSPERLEKCRQALENRRSGRVRPGLDDKVLTGWNALMNQAFTRAADVLGDAGFSGIAIRNMDFLLNCEERAGRLRHTYKGGEYKIEAFLDDHACMISALLALYQHTGAERYLDRALVMADRVIGDFSDEDGLFFYYTGSSQGDVIVRKKEIYDGATPSGNSVMALNLWRLGILTGREDWKQRSGSMLEGVLQVATRYPTSFGVWSGLLMEMVRGTQEIAIVGKGAGVIRGELSREYIPFAVVQWSESENGRHPLTSGKKGGEEALLYLCREYRCLKPVRTTRELMQLIDGESGTKSSPAQ